MSEFSELLGNIIKINNISVYSLSRDIECGRTWLQKVITGERHMDFESFKKLYRRMNSYIDTIGLSKLYESFILDYYGQKEYSIIQYIKERLLETKKLKDYIVRCVQQEEDITDYINTKGIDDCEKEIIQKVYTNMIEEIDCSCKDKRSPQLYINIPSNWKYIKNMILIILNAKGVKETEKFKYLSNCRFENNLEKVQIENFLTSTEFASYGYNTYEGDTNFGFQALSNNIFPYYIITSKIVIMISEDGKAYIENTSIKIIRKISESFEKIVAERKGFLDIVTPDIYSSVAMDKTIDETNEFFELSNGISVTRFYTKDILQQILAGDYPNREFMIETLNMFYENSRRAVSSMYFTIPSVRHFMETDESKNEGGYFNLNFTYEIKLELLKRIYEYYKEGKGEIHMIKADKYLVADGIFIFGWAEKIICASNYIYNKGNAIDAMAVISSPWIARHMRNFNQYIMHSDVCLDHENSLRVLENLIRSYEGKKKRKIS